MYVPVGGTKGLRVENRVAGDNLQRKDDSMKAFSMYSIAAVLSLALVHSVFGAEKKANYSVGQKAPTFQATTTDGKTVKFPEAYKGKVVLVDFWATWCGPCRVEMPNVVSAYKKYHAQGFDVLGISLDRENSGDKLAKFAKDNDMPWPQVYDGKYWKAAVAEQYGIHSIPRPILVDGDTGVVLAEGPDARGEKLNAAIEKALAAKKKS
jgi:peroxiredoxin